MRCRDFFLINVANSSVIALVMCVETFPHGVLLPRWCDPVDKCGTLENLTPKREQRFCHIISSMLKKVNLVEKILFQNDFNMEEIVTRYF